MQGEDLAKYQLQEIEKGAQRAESASNYIDILNESLSVVHPLGSTITTIAKTANWQNIAVDDVALSALEILPMGEL